MGDELSNRREDHCHASIVSGIDAVQVFEVVATALELDALKAARVADTEILERAQVPVVDGFPKSQLGGDAVAEPGRYVLKVAPFWGCCQPQQFALQHVVKQTPVGLGGRLMTSLPNHPPLLFLH